MQAADPSRAQKVATNLQRLSSSAASGAFDTMVSGVRTGYQGGLAYASSSTTSLHNMTTMTRRPGAEQMDSSAPVASAKDNPLRKFEAMVLSTFVESMLPAKATAVYGKGNAGGVWRSMLAQKIGDQVAEAGGIGIAKKIAGRHPEMTSVSGAAATIPAPRVVPPAAAATDPAATAARADTAASAAKVDTTDKTDPSVSDVAI